MVLTRVPRYSDAACSPLTAQVGSAASHAFGRSRFAFGEGGMPSVRADHKGHMTVGPGHPSRNPVDSDLRPEFLFTTEQHQVLPTPPHPKIRSGHSSSHLYARSVRWPHVQIHGGLRLP